MSGPSAPRIDTDDLLALCTCARSYVYVSKAAVRAGAVYCRRCDPPSPGVPASPSRAPHASRRGLSILLQWNALEGRYRTVGTA